ncbi:MAG: hypothetical protein ACK4UT_08755, partial [Moraxellaceae bacterium]
MTTAARKDARWRLTPGRALAASLLLHLFVVIGSELTLPDFYTPPDEVLERRDVENVQRVRLAAAPKPKAEVTGPRYL